MACNNQFRHVCLKDLENYIKRDEYFSDFSDEEKAIIKKNLGITTSGEFSEYDPIVHLLTYDTVLQLKESEELKNVGKIGNLNVKNIMKRDKLEKGSKTEFPKYKVEIKIVAAV